MVAKRPKNPHDVWAKMKADLDLEDDEIPEYLQKDIMKWDAGNKNIPTGIQKPLPVNRPLTRTMQAEGILHALNMQEYPERPMASRKCKDCNEVFRTSYKSNAYCSDLCRRSGLKSFGIDWNHRYNTKSEVDEWAGRVPPYTVPPEVLRIMKYLVLEAEEVKGAPIEPWRPKHVARLNDWKVELDSLESPSPIQSSSSSIPVSDLPSLKERLAALRSKTGLGNSSR